MEGRSTKTLILIHNIIYNLNSRLDLTHEPFTGSLARELRGVNFTWSETSALHGSTLHDLYYITGQPSSASEVLASVLDRSICR